MNPDLVREKEYGELHQAIAELLTVSHASTQKLDSDGGRDTSGDIGGNRPSGGNFDRPRRPKSSNARDFADYGAEMDDWATSYQRRTPDYFYRELERCQSVTRLRTLRDEARASLTAWRRKPLSPGRPDSMADPDWKRWVAEGGAKVKDIVNWYDCSRQYVHQIRAAYKVDEAA